MTSGCGTRRTEDKPGSASGITIWLRGKSSSLRDDFPRRLKGLFFPRIKLLKRAPLLCHDSGGCRRLLGISPHQKAADENYLWQDVRTQSVHGLLQKVLHFRFSPKKQTFPEKQTLGQKDNRHSACPASAGSEVRNLS